MLLTVTVPEFYKKEKQQTETQSETKVRQKRDIKETDKTEEDNNTYAETPKKEGTFVPSDLATSLLVDFYSSLFSSLPEFPKEKAKKTKTQYQAADRLLKRYPIEVIKSVVAYAHTPGGFWIKYAHSVVYLEKKFITLHEQLKNPMNKKQADNKPSKHNNPNFKPKDERPLAFNNKLSFNTKEHLDEMGRSNPNT